MPGQGRLGDKAKVAMDSHGCPACPHPAQGPAIQGSPNVNVNRRPALRVGDDGIHSSCCGANTWIATKGSSTVFINGKSVHRVGDENLHCGGLGQLAEGSSNVIVNDANVASRHVGYPSEYAINNEERRHELARSAAAIKCADLWFEQDDRSAKDFQLTTYSSSIQNDVLRAEHEASVASRSRIEHSFIAIEVRDADGLTIPFAGYRLTASDGSVREGRLDQHGKVYIDHIVLGECEVTITPPWKNRNETA